MVLLSYFLLILWLFLLDYYFFYGSRLSLIFVFSTFYDSICLLFSLSISLLFWLSRFGVFWILSCNALFSNFNFLMLPSSLCSYCILFLSLLSSFSIYWSSLMFSSFTCSVSSLSCLALTVAFFFSFCNSELCSCNNLMSISFTLQIFSFSLTLSLNFQLLLHTFFCSLFLHYWVLDLIFLLLLKIASHCTNCTIYKLLKKIKNIFNRTKQGTVPYWFIMKKVRLTW